MGGSLVTPLGPNRFFFFFFGLRLEEMGNVSQEPIKLLEALMDQGQSPLFLKKKKNFFFGPSSTQIYKHF